MQYFGKWYEPINDGDFKDMSVIKDFAYMGFVDYYTNGYITKPEKVPDGWNGFSWSKPVKWKEDNSQSPAFFHLLYNTNNSWLQRLFFRKIASNKYINDWVSPSLDSDTVFINKPLLFGDSIHPMCIQFITLKNGGFLLDTCQGAYFGNNLTDPLPNLTMNLTKNSISNSNHFNTVIGLPPEKNSNVKEFIYIERGNNRNNKYQKDAIYYNKKVDLLDVYNDDLGSKTINTNILNKIIMTKIPHFESFINNLYLVTTKPISLQPDDYFTINNKTYLLLFNNYAVEVEMEGD